MTSVVPYLALSALIYLALTSHIVLALALAVPTAGFLLRTYIVFHDCAHGSLLPSKRANPVVGRVAGLSCSRRSPAGAMTTPSITAPRATSIVAASGTFSR